MNILILTKGQYPNQHAAAIRHSTIAQGIKEEGHNIEFFVLGKQNWKKKSLNYNGVIYKSVWLYNGENRLFRKISRIIEAKIFNYKIKRIISKKNHDVIICYTTELPIIKNALKAAKKNKIPIFHERTELPNVIGNTASDNTVLKKYLEIYIPEFTGLFLISDKLIRFFKPYNNNCIKITAPVDVEFFSNIDKSPFDFPYIAYCGAMDVRKDGTPTLIKSFSKLLKTYPTIKLVLVGNNTNKNKIKETLQTINKENIQSNIIFTGIIGRKEMPTYLGNAELLVVAKPDNEQNSGNFPNKIGEYLATGVPVVTTKVGEIPLFIKDGYNGFLAEPNSVELFTDKMKEAISSPQKDVIGARGKNTALAEFDYRKLASIVINEIEKVKKTL